MVDRMVVRVLRPVDCSNAIQICKRAYFSENILQHFTEVVIIEWYASSHHPASATMEFAFEIIEEKEVIRQCLHHLIGLNPIVRPDAGIVLSHVGILPSIQNGSRDWRFHGLYSASWACLHRVMHNNHNAFTGMMQARQSTYPCIEPISLIISSVMYSTG